MDTSLTLLVLLTHLKIFSNPILPIDATYLLLIISEFKMFKKRKMIFIGTLPMKAKLYALEIPINSI